MSRRIFSICLVLGLLLLLLAAITTSQGRAQTLTPTPTSCPNLTITGLVYDGMTMKGIAGAKVDVLSYMGQDFMATTVADGTYRVTVVGTSNYACTIESITATAPGYQTYSKSIGSVQLFAQPVINFGMLPLTTPTPSPGASRTPTVTPVSTNNDVPGPDLIISSITYVGSSPACMNSPKDNVVVSNIGTVAAGTFVVSFNSRPAQTVNGLGAGQSITLIIDAGGTITATADSTGVIAETNESNNSLTVMLPAPTQAYTCTPTRTPTGPTPTRTRTPTAGLTPTRTPTCPCFSVTPTRTPTPQITVTPPPGGVCSPVTGVIVAPFTYDGAGDFCWQSTNLGSYINSWNLTTLTINGVDFNNKYIIVSSLPPLINGYWYVHYVSAVSYGHFEAK
jgi:hypothetical protein